MRVLYMSSISFDLRETFGGIMIRFAPHEMPAQLAVSCSVNLEPVGIPRHTLCTPQRSLFAPSQYIAAHFSLNYISTFLDSDYYLLYRYIAHSGAGSP